MNLVFPSAEFDDAVAAVCHGSATEAEMEALNRLLRCDPGARDEYLVRLELHTRLASDPELFARGTENPPEGLGRRPGADPRGPGFPPQPTPTPPWRRAWRPLALAAGLVLAVAGVWKIVSMQPSSRRDATSSAVAMLTRVVDARWSSDFP